VESKEIVVPIVVVIQLELQTELRDPINVNVLEGRTVQPGPIPAIVGIVFDYASGFYAGRSLEIGRLQAPERERAERAECAGSNIHLDVPMCFERVGTYQTCSLDHQQRFCDYCIVRQSFCGEIQYGTVLTIASIITEDNGVGLVVFGLAPVCVLP
jgi:hypothetical protein